MPSIWSRVEQAPKRKERVVLWEEKYLCVNSFFQKITLLRYPIAPPMFWTRSLFLKDQVHTPRLLSRTSWDLCDAANVAWYLTHKSSCVTIVLLTRRSSFYSLSNRPNNNSTRIYALVFIKIKLSFNADNMMKNEATGCLTIVPIWTA